MVQTRREIESLLNGAGIRPLKRYGQNFLIDGNLIRKLVDAAEIGPADLVLEVGPGTGSLTEELLARAGHVVAVEIDKGLSRILRDRFADNDRFTLVNTDVLHKKSAVSPLVLHALHDKRPTPPGRTMLVANLPYQAATPLIVDLLLGDDYVSPLCFTVQAEVADRFLSPAGTKEYGPISVYAQALAEGRRIARCPPEAFWPAPDVHSAMVRLDIHGGPPNTEPVRRTLGRLVHACFLHRRKTMRGNLKTFLDAAMFERVATDGRWNLDQRPEQITVAQWVAMARFLAESAPSL